MIKYSARVVLLGFAAMSLLAVSACAPADVPDPRTVNIPSPEAASSRKGAVNEQPESVIYLPLGNDVLVPQVAVSGGLPSEEVGPFELRSETLAGALQLILADYDVSLAFETDRGLTSRITVANLRGPLDRVVRRVCSLADLYCAFEDGLLIVKETQTFTVKIPPISQDTDFMENIAGGLRAIIGESPIVDESTRTLVYEASHRTSEYAKRYFQQMRSSTALITFETYIWEVNLESDNSTGIEWDNLESFGKFTADINIAGATGGIDNTPISIGLPSTGFEEGGTFTPSDVFSFLTEYGAVKTISQPQVTVLSGSEARLRVADTQNFVSEVTQTIDNGQTSTSVNTSSVDSGFELIIGSNWDNATVYADISINLSTVISIEPFNFQSTGEGNDQTTTQIQLPNTSERELTTQVRMRPGDSLLIAGLVEENDNLDTSGIGMNKPTLPTSRSVGTENNELVFLLRPRVVVYTSQEEYMHYVEGKRHKEPEPEPEEVAVIEEEPPFEYDFSPLNEPAKTEDGVQLDSKGRPLNLLDKAEHIVSENNTAAKGPTIAQVMVDQIMDYDEMSAEADKIAMTVAEEPVFSAAKLSASEEEELASILTSLEDAQPAAGVEASSPAVKQAAAKAEDSFVDTLLMHGESVTNAAPLPVSIPVGGQPTGAPVDLNAMKALPALKPNVLGMSDDNVEVLPRKKPAPMPEKTAAVTYSDITAEALVNIHEVVNNVPIITSSGGPVLDPS